MPDEKTDHGPDSEAPAGSERPASRIEVIRERGGCWKGLLVIAVTFLIVAWLGYRCARDVARSSLDAVGALDAAVQMEEDLIDVSAVVTQVRGLARLETTSMEVVQVLTARQSHGVIPDAIAGDELTLVAVGEVIAGVDLSKLSEEDAWIEDGTLVLKLPRTEILVTRLDNSQSRVVNRDTGLFRRADEGLEGRARERAEIAIRNKALREGIHETARENAERQLAEFLGKLGAERVRFVSSEALPSGEDEQL